MAERRDTDRVVPVRTPPRRCPSSLLPLGLALLCLTLLAELPGGWARAGCLPWLRAPKVPHLNDPSCFGYTPTRWRPWHVAVPLVPPDVLHGAPGTLPPAPPIPEPAGDPTVAPPPTPLPAPVTWRAAKGARTDGQAAPAIADPARQGTLPQPAGPASPYHAR